jgi:hypothetical protein
MGELRFTGRRLRPGGHADGYWKVQPPGFDVPVGVDFANENGDPYPEGLRALDALLSDLDALFERSAKQVSEAYKQIVEELMPQEWRAAFRLEHISVPDDKEREPEWQVTYWCEAALHWFVVSYRGEEVVDVSIEG